MAKKQAGKAYRWSDKKRYFGLPISFIRYYADEKRLFKRSGILTRREEQVSLYHIRDFEVAVRLRQRIFGVGTVKVIGVDATTPTLLLENIKNPYDVRDILYELSEQDKDRRRMNRTEFMTSGGADGDGLDDGMM